MQVRLSMVALFSFALLNGACAGSNAPAEVTKKEEAKENKLANAIEYPSAKEIIEKDLIPAPTKVQMPNGCVTDDKERIANGKLFFHNLNSKKAKIKTADGKLKQYGNCVACHNIEGAKGYGNIGPDLTNYKEYFVDSKVRDAKWVYQKIADPRIDNANTHMTVNLVNGLMSEREVCDLVSYIISEKGK